MIRWFIARWLEQEIYQQRLLGVSLRVTAENHPSGSSAQRRRPGRAATSGI
jgi:hypothetical protein